MVRGTRVEMVNDNTRAGTVVAYLPETKKLLVLWDKTARAVSVSRQMLRVIGFDPAKGSKRGIWRRKEIKYFDWER